jgi:hypothetical protein
MDTQEWLISSFEWTSFKACDSADETRQWNLKDKDVCFMNIIKPIVLEYLDLPTQE